jgi:hypothetical protein
VPAGQVSEPAILQKRLNGFPGLAGFAVFGNPAAPVLTGLLLQTFSERLYQQQSFYLV